MWNCVLFRLVITIGLLPIFAKPKGIKIAEVDFLTVVSQSQSQSQDNQSSALNQTKTNLVPTTTQTMMSPELDNGEGRGHLHRRKKIFKHLYPVLMAVLFAKLIVVPLVLKLLIATTSSAFVMSKIALVTSALIGLSWLLGATRERAKLQIVQYPAPNGSKKVHGGWNVQEKYSSQYGPFNDWGYDDAIAESNDKNFFL